jgi:uncharacterized protein (TIGR00369 family)
MPDQTSDGAALAKAWIENSAFVEHLGIELEAMEPGTARLRLPYSGNLPTMGEVVHGGAISSLIDTAAAAAAWSGAEVPEKIRASTVGLTVNFLAPAKGADVVAEARVLRRGGVSVVAVDVSNDEGERVATALVTYRL